MQKAQRGKNSAFNASTYRLGIVVADFNADVTSKLLASAKAEAKKYLLPSRSLAVHRVAGSVEIPVVLKALAEAGKYDALVALGAIIRGETDHYAYVAELVTGGVLEVMIDDEPIPVGFGVLTCETKEQALARTHSGAGAVAAALGAARVLRHIRGKHTA